jgi:hypothetical protein
MLSETAKKTDMVLDNEEDEDGADDHLSMSDSSYTGTSASKNGHEAKQDETEKRMRDKIIKKEEKAVRKARILVIGAFIACATAVSVAVYKFASRADYRSFELEVRGRKWLVLEDDRFMFSVYFNTTTAAFSD